MGEEDDVDEEGDENEEERGKVEERTVQRMYVDVTHEVRMYGRLHDVVDVCACRGIVDMHDDDVCMSYECV